jgi:hypothetical protein
LPPHKKRFLEESGRKCSKTLPHIKFKELGTEKLIQARKVISCHYPVKVMFMGVTVTPNIHVYGKIMMIIINRQLTRE